MTLSGYGYDGAVLPVQSVHSDTIKVSGPRVEYRRGVITEWYLNDKRGLEQGVTLKEPPVKKDAESLVVEWTVSGSMVPRLEQEGLAIAFGKEGRTPALRYSGLKDLGFYWPSSPVKIGRARREAGRFPMANCLRGGRHRCDVSRYH